MSTSNKSVSFNLSLSEGNAGYDVLHNAEKPLGFKTVAAYEKQHASPSTRPVMTQQQQLALQAKKKTKALAIATKPGQQIAMNAFMMYMSGKNLNIFSISITSMAVLSPLTSMLTMGKTFGPLEQGGTDLQLAKLIFVGLNLVWLCIGLYKMSSMRLLPTTSADWTGSVVWKEMMETSSIPPVW